LVEKIWGQEFFTIELMVVKEHLDMFIPKKENKQVSRQFKGIPQDKEFVKRRAESVKKHYNSEEGKKTIEYLNRKKEEYFASEEGKKRLLDLSKKWSGKI